MCTHTTLVINKCYYSCISICPLGLITEGIMYMWNLSGWLCVIGMWIIYVLIYWPSVKPWLLPSQAREELGYNLFIVIILAFISLYLNFSAILRAWDWFYLLALIFIDSHLLASCQFQPVSFMISFDRERVSTTLPEYKICNAVWSSLKLPKALFISFFFKEWFHLLHIRS